MITKVTDLDLDALLDQETISRETITYIKEQVYSSRENREALEEKIEELKLSLKKEHDSTNVKNLTLLLGICEWICGRIKESLELLKEVRSRKIASYYLGKCYQEMGELSLSLECFERAKKADAEEFDIGMDIAETKRMSGDVEGALKMVKNFVQEHENNAELYYLWGHCLDDLGEYQEAFSKYERALQIDPNHAKSLFRMAFNYDIDGEDEKAIEYYERCAKQKPTYTSAFINLGVLYEDKGEYENAMYCFDTVLDAEPTNKRALLFLKDVKASISMYYDEEISKKQGKENEVLNIPISDFELSVRSKNCLEKMNIHTLRDLTKIAEADLLSFKNFGETSLNEIKIILAQKGLRLGQAIENDETELFGVLGKKREKSMVQTIADLGLSTRCRNMLWKIGTDTIDDLITKTEDELKQKGVRQNYIDEIKHNLFRFDLSLKSDENPGEEEYPEENPAE
ncbi:MAG: DNA-directed RNA polymerase subunit alpha C-terminal domain-containing protein [Candidatus Loosdrechtia sp.]|uniref:DNA-directed RNA polymerase subunit alpha C-terminal domain-containing protein n=1 Tax=Candidatus Loosdrechtia sp. TaxID=3101272 RepID=UPI003A634DDD|nr:MAG: DNA-directed RNA polymerase subunit alpha C-terminal domain-containing protein [Candidatus Jettenia sp. AMX2]